ncbi:unnamed protein product [Heterobilharzia americana]|nr:unnamed protein product [Heterobilharzia americana]
MSSDNDCDSSCVITSVGFVTQTGNKQQKHEVLCRTVDTSEDACLWSSSLLTRRSRYLCYISENVNTCHGPKPVLVNLVLIDDGDRIPENHQAVYNTLDTGERALKRKILCARYLPRLSTSHAITKIFIYSRTRAPAAGFTRVGDINSLNIWCKHSDIGLQNSADKTGGSVRPPVPSRPSLHSGNHNYPSFPSLPSPGDDYRHAFATTRRGTVHPLSGVPFEINKRYLADEAVENRNTTAYSVYKTLDQINSEFQYRFDQERFLLATST